MKKSKYAALDEEIVRHIKLNDCATDYSLFASQRIATVIDMLPPSLAGEGDPWKLLWRRLRALRKAGLIRYMAGLWYVIEKDREQP